MELVMQIPRCVCQRRVWPWQARIRSNHMRCIAMVKLDGLLGMATTALEIAAHDLETVGATDRCEEARRVSDHVQASLHRR